MSVADQIVTVVDLETTGLAPPAAVIEMGWVRGCASLGAMSDVTTCLWTDEEQSLFSPGEQVITPENRAIHHIDPVELEGLPVLDCTHWMLRDLLESDFVAAHNAAFEQQWLNPLLHACREWLDEDSTPTVPRWICTKKCAIATWPELVSHSNQVLRYAVPVWGCSDDELSPPHRALPDARVTSRLLEALLAHNTLDQLADITATPLAYARLPFGKHKGQPLTEVPNSYLRWMLANERDPDLIFTAQAELERRAGNDT